MSAVDAAVPMNPDSLLARWSSGVLSEYIERPEYGYTDSASDDASGTKFLRITDIQDGQVNWLTVPYCQCPADVLTSKRLLAGDVVVARIGATTGKSFYIDSTPDDAVFASYLIRLRAKRGKLLPRYLYYYMQSAEYWAHVDLHKGDRLKGGVNIAVLESLPVVVPPLPEQARIVSVLDLLQSAVRSEATRASQATELQHAAMSDLYAHGLRGEDQKETELGAMPESWDVVSLGSIGKIGNGSTPKRSNLTYWGGGSFPWLTSAKVYDRDIESAEEFVTDTALDECHLPRVQPGAVLMAITGQGKTLGHVAVLNIEATVNQHIAYVQTDVERAEPAFIRGYLETQYDALRQVGAGGGSTKGALTCAFLRGLAVPLPELSEQREIVSVLRALDQKVNLHKKKLGVLNELFTAMLHKLIAGEISVGDLDLSALPNYSVPPTEVVV